MIKVAATILKRNNRILIAERNKGDRLGGKWEFPGGKIEKGESPQQCLIRELKEEFNLNIEVKEFLGETTYEYDFGVVNLVFYNAVYKSGSLISTSHAHYLWEDPCELKNFDFAPADKEIIERITEDS